jgi:hypothetical protein
MSAVTLNEFEQWFIDNYPADCIISKPAWHAPKIYRAATHGLNRERDQLESDAMTLAMRLYAESDDTFAPETIEVMKRWRPKVLAKLQGK